MSKIFTGYRIHCEAIKNSNKKTKKRIYELISWFKRNYEHKPKEEILHRLKLLSEEEFDNLKPYRQRRLKPKNYRLNQYKCWICKINKATLLHHIILIKNGGVNDNLNTIPICKDCHKEIHPWLQ